MPQENKKKERVKKMIKFGKWVVKFRIPILILSFLLLIPTGIIYMNTRINYDILSYLPGDIETMKGQDILLDEFGTGAFSVAVIDGMQEKEITQLEDKLKELAGLAEEKRELSGTTVIDASLFSSLDLALKPGIELESLEFLANEGTIRIKLLTDDARNIPQFVQDMEEEGFFMEQSSWQKQEMKVHVEILLKPGKEEKHETQ